MLKLEVSTMSGWSDGGGAGAGTGVGTIAGGHGTSAPVKCRSTGLRNSAILAAPLELETCWQAVKRAAY